MKKLTLLLFIPIISFSQNEDILLNGSVSVEGNQIKNVADPTDLNDAVNKQYVDELSTNGNNTMDFQSLQYPDGISSETVIITQSESFQVPAGKNFTTNFIQGDVLIDNINFNPSSYTPQNIMLGPEQTLIVLEGFVTGFLTNPGVTPITIDLITGNYVVPENRLFVLVTTSNNDIPISINGHNPNPFSTGGFPNENMILGPGTEISCQCAINGYLK